MKLSRNWLREFVDLSLEECNDKDFAEAMTISGSKVEVTEDLSKDMVNVVAGRILSIEKHPNSDHMLVTMIDVGEDEPIQICTGAWNVHVGDMIPVAKDKSILPGGIKINKGKLRGVPSCGMLCSMKELAMSEHDFPYVLIKPAALLNDYHPIDPAKPSIAADIQPGDKVFGPVVAAKVLEVSTVSYRLYHTVLDTGKDTAVLDCDCSNLHEGDMVAYNTKSESICTLEDLHADQKEFPNCIADGILILNEEGLKAGDDMCAYLGLNDHVVEFEITPNRPDCLCVIGLAREAAVTFNKELKLHTPVVKEAAGGDINEHVKIFIDDPLCRRYTARMVKNVKIAPSPEWMCERLRNSGLRPINNIVDITNYVMLEYGQPMHAFDFACVNGNEIHVRRAKEGETLETLDGNARELSTNMLCICDIEKPVGLAGVMGGANSEIVGDTAMVLFESANFNGASIRRTATALGMRTDASARYEKGLDVENTMRAIERACELVELLGAGEVVKGIIDVFPDKTDAVTVKLEPEKINALLGTDIDEATMREILLPLGFELDGDIITVPSWRGDVEHYSDIAEEVARFYGYNKIPIAFAGGNTSCGSYSEVQEYERQLGSICRSMGMDEIITYSFISPSCYDKIRLPADSSLRDSLKILNPLGEDTSIMRTTTLPSMLEILTRNYNFRNKSAKLYEIGRVYFKRPDGLADEPKILSMGCYGEGMDFYTIKGNVEELLDAIRVKGKVSFKADKTNPSYHPGRCAKVYIDDCCIGTVGQIHPLTAANYGIDDELFCAELSFEGMFDKLVGRPIYKALPRFPATTRDLSVVCKAEVTVGQLQDTILASGGEYLKDCSFVDVYTGAPIQEGYKSVTFALTLRADDQTLTDEHAEQTMNAVLDALKNQHEAVIR